MTMMLRLNATVLEDTGSKQDVQTTNLPDLAIPGVIVHKLIRSGHATGDWPTLVNLLHHPLHDSTSTEFRQMASGAIGQLVS